MALAEIYNLPISKWKFSYEYFYNIFLARKPFINPSTEFDFSQDKDKTVRLIYENIFNNSSILSLEINGVSTINKTAYNWPHDSKCHS